MVITLRTNVNSKYFAINGMVEDVGGRILETNRRKTTMDRRTLMVKVIFSPESKNGSYP